MSINSINKVSSAQSASTSSTSSSNLSKETIKKLKALGLDPSDYATEAEAEAAIAQAQNKNQIPNQANGIDKEAIIRADAEGLAYLVGVSVYKNDKVSDIINNISDKISSLKESAGSDETKLSEIASYQSKLDALSNKYAEKETSKSMLSNSMEALANYNKASLGFAA